MVAGFLVSLSLLLFYYFHTTQHTHPSIDVFDVWADSFLMLLYLQNTMGYLGRYIVSLRRFTASFTDFTLVKFNLTSVSARQRLRGTHR